MVIASADDLDPIFAVGDGTNAAFVYWDATTGDLLCQDSWGGAGDLGPYTFGNLVQLEIIYDDVAGTLTYSRDNGAETYVNTAVASLANAQLGVFVTPFSQSPLSVVGLITTVTLNGNSLITAGKAPFSNYAQSSGITVASVATTLNTANITGGTLTLNAVLTLVDSVLQNATQNGAAQLTTQTSSHTGTNSNNTFSGVSPLFTPETLVDNPTFTIPYVTTNEGVALSGGTYADGFDPSGVAAWIGTLEVGSMTAAGTPNITGTAATIKVRPGSTLNGFNMATCCTNTVWDLNAGVQIVNGSVTSKVTARRAVSVERLGLAG
jgi:hypothetical protein